MLLYARPVVRARIGRMAQPLNPGFGAPWPNTPPPVPITDRIPRVVQGIITAVGVVVVLGLYAVQDSVGNLSDSYGDSEFWIGLAIDALIGLLLLVLVVIMGLGVARRVGGAVLAVLALVLTAIPNLLVRYSSGPDFDYGVLPFLYGGAAFAQFAAWGIARRRHPLWLVAALPAGGLIAYLQWAAGHTEWFADLVIDRDATDYQNSPTAWIAYFGAFVGPVVIGSALAWAFDGLGRAVGRSSRPSFPAPPTDVGPAGHGSAGHPDPYGFAPPQGFGPPPGYGPGVGPPRGYGPPPGYAPPPSSGGWPPAPPGSHHRLQ